jgi:hypothetical protein
VFIECNRVTAENLFINDVNDCHRFVPWAPTYQD